jgi:hypothetical protein
MLPALTAVVVAVGLSGWYLSGADGPRAQVVSCWLAVAGYASAMSYYAFRASRQMDRADPAQILDHPGHRERGLRRR